MENVVTNEYEVAVEPGRVLVSMNPREDKAIAASDFVDRPLAQDASQNQSAFYGATNDVGELVRVVSTAISDRAAVAALVAGWIAEGLDVTRFNQKDLGKHVRMLEKREKELAAQAKAQAEAIQTEAAKITEFAPHTVDTSSSPDNTARNEGFDLGSFLSEPESEQPTALPV